jgi:hypothetical protein
MTYTPRTLIKSRSVLQTLTHNRQEHLKYILFDALLDTIWQGVFQCTQARQTKYIFNMEHCKPSHFGIHYLFPYGNVSDAFRCELMDILKKEYPECYIHYVETVGYVGNIVERLIVIDWSIS